MAAKDDGGDDVVVGRPDEESATQAEEIGAGLVAMGSRKLGGIRRAFNHPL